MAKRWQQLIGQVLEGIYPALEAMTDSELRTVRSAANKRSNTNCWWLTFSCAPAIADVADIILRNRYMIRRTAKRAAKKCGAA